jgi:hypothetical protein
MSFGTGPRPPDEALDNIILLGEEDTGLDWEMLKTGEGGRGGEYGTLCRFLQPH